MKLSVIKKFSFLAGIVFSLTNVQGTEVEQVNYPILPCELWQHIVILSDEKDISAILSSLYETSTHLKHVAWLIRKQKFYNETQAWTAGYPPVKGLLSIELFSHRHGSGTLEDERSKKKIVSFGQKLRLANFYNTPIHVQIYHLHQAYSLSNYDFSYVSELEIPVCTPNDDYRLNDKAATDIAHIIETSSMLTTLIIGNHSLTDVMCITIVNALKINTSLTKLDLRCGGTGNESAIALGDALRQNNTLTSLKFYNYHLSDDDKLGGFCPLINAVSVNASLEEFELLGDGCGPWSTYGTKGCVALANLFKENKTLKKFSWSIKFSESYKGDCIISESALNLLKILRSNPNLREDLKVNRNLTEWNLTLIKMPELSILEALKMNSSLTDLTLTKDIIQSKTGVELLAGIIKTNTSLIKLNLERNDLKLSENLFFADAFQINSTLQKLTICSSDFRILSAIPHLNGRLESSRRY